MAGEVEREDRKATFHWKLNFSSLGDRVTNYHDSPGFLFGGRNWLLNIFPNTGDGKRSDGYVVLGVMVWDLEPARDVRYSVGIRTADGGTEMLASGTKTFDSRYNGARLVLMERAELLRRSDELLPQDTLTFTVTLELEDGSSETESPTDAVDPNLESLSLDLSKLLEDKVLSDVKLKCAERTFSAHRAVLAARSEVFRAMFKNKMSESQTGVVDVPDLEAPVVEHLLRCVYTGKVQDLTEDLVPGMYEACDKYAVHALKKACSDRMIAGLTEGNCVGTLTFADAHSDAPFKQQVVSFICGRERIFKSEVWLSFLKNHKELAIEVYDSYFRSKN